MAQTAVVSNVHLTRGSLLARNTVWNLVGSGAPMVVALFCIPILIRGLGKERFGVLTLVWAIIGYASLLDLGLGRALTQLAARKLGRGEDRDVPVLVWTSLLLMLLLGLGGTVIAALLSPWMVYHVLNVPSALQRETVRAIYLLGLSIPLVITTSGMRGLLEAYQRFGVINALRIPMGILTFASPLLILPFSRSLVPVVGILVFSRLLGWAAHLIACRLIVPGLRNRVSWQRSAVGPLLRFGGWMTVSNVLGPLMVTLDRFLIGAMVSMSAVAYYATPYEVVTKFWLIPSALTGVMFPAFSTSFVRDREHTALLFSRSIKFLLLALFPIMLCTLALAKNGLQLWLGTDFAEHSVRVLQWLAFGVFINSLAQLPFAMLQGAGRPDLTATLHVIELPLYVVSLWLLIRSRGIEGAAIAWTARVAVDAVLLFLLASRLFPRRTPDLRTLLLVVTALITLASGALVHGVVAKGFFLFAAISSFAVGTWFLVLTPEERALAQSYR